MRVFIIFFCILNVSLRSFAQEEELSELNYSWILKKESQKAIMKSRSIEDTLELPFVDDFSFSNVYPSDSLWADRDVFVNTSYPVSPVSVGVATFDGLKWNGEPYFPNVPNAHGVADYLTSRPLNLNYIPADSIYLSFYFQPNGIGNEPEPRDSLVLEFLSVQDSVWRWQWSSKGFPLQGFKHVVISITDTNFLKKGFVFRFKNYATESGSFDHWHLDYVRLDKNRTMHDTTYRDVAFTVPANIMLKNYREMPWRQFKVDPAAEMFDSMTVRLRNNHSSVINVNYTLAVFDRQHTLLKTLSGSATPAPQTDFSFGNKLDFTFPVTSTNAFETFEVLNYISVNSDVLSTNDTIRHIQAFPHYFAYDDGSAEAGYGHNEYGAQLAYRFTLYQPDTLTAIMVHFTNALASTASNPFKFTVWSDFNGAPGNIIYQEQGLSYPAYTNELNGFYTYPVSGTVILNGTIYIGWVQTNNVKLNVGYDKNTDSRDRIFFNVDGSWNGSQLIVPGSLMIRPVLGTEVYVGTEKFETPVKNTITLYPNPAKDKLFINGIENNEGWNISVFDLYGRVVFSGENTSGNSINAAEFPNGIYFLRIEDKLTRKQYLEKVLIAR